MAASGPTEQKPFKTTFIGEGGSYTQPTGGAADGMETISRQQGGQGTFGPIDAPGEPREKVPAPGRTPAPSQSPSVATSVPGVGGGATAAVSERRKPSAAPSDASGMEALRDAPSAIAGASPITAARPLPQGSSAADRFREPPPKPEPKPDPSRYSLWSGLSAPLELPGEKVNDVSADEASTLGRRDYASHILGAREVAPAQAPVGAPAAGDARPEKTRAFVTVELQLAPVQTLGPAAAPVPGSPSAPVLPANLDAALKGLTATGFESDSRFPPEFHGTQGDRVRVWGWIASEKVGGAMSAPGVSKFEIDRTPGRSSGVKAGDTELLIGIRVPTPASGPEGTAAVQKAFAEAVRRLEARTGFSWRRTIGYQEAPGGGWVVVTQGKVPLRAISQVLADRDVVKVVPSPDAGLPAAPPPSPIRPLEDFLSFALGRAPILLGATLLMLIPSLGGMLLTAAEIFIPYRRL